MVSKIRDETSNKQYVSGKEKKSLRNRKLKRSCFVLFFLTHKSNSVLEVTLLRAAQNFSNERDFFETRDACISLPVSLLLRLWSSPTSCQHSRSEQPRHSHCHGKRPFSLMRAFFPISVALESVLHPLPPPWQCRNFPQRPWDHFLLTQRVSGWVRTRWAPRKAVIKNECWS